MPAPIKNGTTTVELIAAVPFNGTTEQILFKNINDQNRYFSGRVLRGKYQNQQGQWIYSNIGFTNGSYQRYEYVLRLNIDKEDLYDSANYMRFRNSNNHKWVYAYITDMHWNNSSECDIFFYIDSWQTYMFEVWWKPSLIERESPNTDEIGQYEEQEEISFSNYIETAQRMKFINSTGYQYRGSTLDEDENFNGIKCGYIVELSNDFKIPFTLLSNGKIVPTTIIQNGIAKQGIFLFFYSASEVFFFINTVFSSGITSEDASKINSIYSIPIYPFRCDTDYMNGYIGSTKISYSRIRGLRIVLSRTTYTAKIVEESHMLYQIINESDVSSTEGGAVLNDEKYNLPLKVTAEISLPYTPKNNKLYNSPFIILTLESQNDTINIKTQGYKIKDNKFVLEFDFNMNIFNTAYTLFLSNYNRANFLRGIYDRYASMYKVTLPVFPSTSAYIDATSQWWRQNGVKTIANLTLAAASLAVGFGAIGAGTAFGSMIAGGTALSLPSTAKGGTRSNNERNDYQVMGGIAAGVNEITKIYSSIIAPDYQVGNLSGYDAFGSNISMVKLTMSYLIEDEVMQADDYLSLYGYSIKKVKMPDFVQEISSKQFMGTQYGEDEFITQRPYWYYLKTAICNISSFTQRNYPGSYDPNDRALLANNQGLIPQEHLEKIKNMFNNGIRLWLFNNFSTSFDINILNYTLDNSVS